MRTKLIEIGGKQYRGPDLAKQVGIVSWPVAYARLKLGWSAYDAFHTPLRVAGAEAEINGVDKWKYKARKHQYAIDWHIARRDAALGRLADLRAKLADRAERETVSEDWEDDVVKLQQGEI